MAKEQAAAPVTPKLLPHQTMLPDGTIVEDNTKNPAAVSPVRGKAPQGAKAAPKPKSTVTLPDGTIVEDF
jgi:hypothetical protein